MKSVTIINALLAAGFVTTLGFELGIFQRAFDCRSIVKDGVVGSDYWIVKVDGQPTDRIQHGCLITKVPFALLEPGDRVIELSATPHPDEDTEITEFHATIEKGVNYRISRNADGNPELIATQ
jgi:hypothetical protein